MKLEELRKKIDSTDGRILKLLNERASLARRIGALKQKAGKDFYIPHREKKIIAGLLARNCGPLSSESVESIYREIMNACRSLESRLTVTYFGPEATFTHQAALKNFGTAAVYVPATSIADVFTEVAKKRADYGVVPIENSTEGVVNHTLDMFMDSDLQICSEISMPIEQCLLSLSGDIKRVKKAYSHPQALVQCRNWLKEHLPGIPVVETSSTSAAARRAVREKDSAAVSSYAAAQLYKLEVISRGIEDNPENFTRFLVIGRCPADYSGHDKTSIMFAIKHKVGALYEMLSTFKKHGINMTRIESRPSRKQAWEYLFFVDILGHVSEKHVQTALKGLAAHCSSFKVLGSYPKAD